MKTPLIQRNSGFTLIELLATVTIVALLVAFLGQVFSQASIAWERGTQQVIRNANAKAALEIIARDLEMAVVDEQFGFYKDRRGEPGWAIVDFDDLYFITMGGRPTEDERSYQAVRYRAASGDFFDRGFTSTRLNRDEIDFSEMIDAAGDPFSGNWWDSFPSASFDNVAVIDDIARLDIYLYSGDEANFGDNPTRLLGATATTDGNLAHDFNTHNDMTIRFPNDREGGLNEFRIPAYIDIYLQVTSPDAMRRADLLRAAGNTEAAKEVLDANSNVLFKRVYPRMRNAIR